MLRGNKYVVFGGAVVASLIVGASGSYFLTNSKASKKLTELQTQLDSTTQQLLACNKMVYAPIEDIAFGTVITESNVVPVNVRSDRLISEYLGKEDLGKVALVSLPAGVPVMKNMVAENSDPQKRHLRQVETDYLWMPLTLKEGQFVDIRIVFPNGEDKVVVSKTQVKLLTTAANLSYFWFSEDEILRLDGAVVDAARKPGAKIYVVEYVQPEMQEASVVTYDPSADVIEAIVNSPNVVDESAKMLSKTARAGLEARIAAFVEANPDLTADEVFGRKFSGSGEGGISADTDLSVGDSNQTIDPDIMVGDPNVMDSTEPTEDTPVNIGDVDEENSIYDFEEGQNGTNTPITIDGDSFSGSGVFIGGD